MEMGGQLQVIIRFIPGETVSDNHQLRQRVGLSVGLDYMQKREISGPAGYRTQNLWLWSRLPTQCDDRAVPTPEDISRPHSLVSRSVATTPLDRAYRAKYRHTPLDSQCA
jgi:hypothetical protein